jgi:putative redox protein
MAATRTEKITFIGAERTSRLAARLDLPDGPPRAFALFAHCFTCTQNVFAATRIAQVTRHGIAALRFDFTGLGASEGSSPTPTSPRTSATCWPPRLGCAPNWRRPGC